jgi:hypothetical protein
MHRTPKKTTTGFNKWNGMEQIMGGDGDFFDRLHGDGILSQPGT